MRNFSDHHFEHLFDQLVAGSRWQEEPDYYPRYRTRYEAVLRRFAAVAPAPPLDVLDVGGGQLALLSTKLWSDRASAADVVDTCFPVLQAHGVATFQWNIATQDPPLRQCFDAAFLSEVIEHLPVPGHVALARIRACLRPGGVLVASTPNLYRLRNVAYLALGRPLFDHFDIPGDHGFGHVLEYSAQHLEWQLRRAGFDDFTVQLREFHHVPQRLADRLLSAVGAPLRVVPRFRDNLLVTARVT